MFKATNSPFVIALFVLLAIALSMGSPFVNIHNFWERPLISVGETKIYEGEFRKLFSQKVRSLGILKASGSISPVKNELQYILEEIVKDLALREEIRTLDFRVSDGYVKQVITRYPEFQDGKNQFSERKFRENLKNLSLGLKEFLRMEKERIAKQRLRRALLSQLYTPSILQTYVSKALAQRRVIRWKYYSTSEIKNIPVSPTLKELKEFYQRKEKIKAPRSRRVVVLKVPLHAKSDQAMIKVEEELSAGQSLENIGKKLSLEYKTVIVRKFKDLDQFMSDRSTQSLKKIAYDKIVRMAPESAPEILQDSQGRYILNVQAIEPERVLTFEEAKPLLKVRWLRMMHRKLAKAQALKDQNQAKIQQMQKDYVTWLSPHRSLPEIVWSTAFKMALHQFRIIEDRNSTWLVYLEGIEELYRTPEQLREIQLLLQEEWKLKAWYSYVQGLLKQFQVEININRIEKILQKQKKE